ncbi:glutaminyl-tRNA synthetase [Buchnera aphidicola (Cinara tujafilina)]|uniref:Glutamine--tRNA ligase n=1 Tax=Buchnera aphidicola (Cinara tujafilina) TaxID=261317 RepID=F7WZI5_9GAMM|nr:glutamine--tRNA ligase [Buchnera aphidicola]AEH39852.1 glutaminyl-tRNA synthetase [Buchnera aphidicola (Cinara tujafilina)]
MSINIPKGFIKKNIISIFLKYPNQKICTRFPPEPNGYLHIGHAKAIILNFGIAQEYKGNCYLRLDDTNPSNEKIKYVKSIKKDIKWLGFKWNSNVKYSSDYFQILYQYAIKLIKKNLAYVEQLNQKQIKEYRGSLIVPGRNSPFRNQTIEENLFLFKKMKLGIFQPGSMCLRAKINMASANIVMRDPVLYRIIFKKHHQTNYDWVIYPMYDFTHCIADALEGITHSFCTLEFQDNRQLYKWILKKLDFTTKIPKQYEFSKLNLEYTILSKRKLQKLITSKLVHGWDDPRLYTLSGLRNRGYTPNSIKIFCKKIGFTKQQNTIELSLLESCIKKDLDQISPRRMAILNPIKIIITNFPDNHIEYIQAPNHPKNFNMGIRNIIFSNELFIEKNDFSTHNFEKYQGLELGKKVKLRYSYVIKAYQIVTDKHNNVKHILCKYYPNTLGKNIKKQKINGIIHWLSIKNIIPVTFNLFDHLFLSKYPEKNKNPLKEFNVKSYIKKNGFVEQQVESEKIKHAYQFERIGYFFRNKQNIYAKKEIIFNQIVSLKNKYKKNN